MSLLIQVNIDAVDVMHELADRIQSFLSLFEGLSHEVSIHFQLQST